MVNPAFGPRVLVIGDSHTAAFGFGKRLKEDIEATGAKVTVDAESGKSPPYFVRAEKDGTSRIAKDVAAANPTSVVIALGTNFKEDVQGKGGAGFADRYVGMTVKELRKAGYKGDITWIGRPTNPEDMPDKSKVAQFDKEMSEAAAKYGVRYISSKDATSCVDPARPDAQICRGEHIVDKTAAYAWADDVFERISKRD